MVQRLINVAAEWELWTRVVYGASFVLLIYRDVLEVTG